MPEQSVEDRVVFTVNLSPRARVVADRLKSDFGVTKTAAVERGLNFLLSLPAEVLQEVFRDGGDPVGRLVKLKQAEAAGVDPNATSIDQSMAIIRQQLDRVENLARAYRRELEDEGSGGKSKKKPGGK